MCHHSSEYPIVFKTSSILHFCIRVVVGEHDYTDSTDGQVSVTPSSWLSHPSYESSTTNYDFAILRLSTALTFSRYLTLSQSG